MRTGAPKLDDGRSGEKELWMSMQSLLVRLEKLLRLDGVKKFRFRHDITHDVKSELRVNLTLQQTGEVSVEVKVPEEDIRRRSAKLGIPISIVRNADEHWASSVKGRCKNAYHEYVRRSNEPGLSLAAYDRAISRSSERVAYA